MTPATPPASNTLRVLGRAAPWAAALAVLGLVLFLVIRSTGYDAGPVFRYAAYYLLYVALPGIVALQAIQRRPLSVTTAIALGLPTGYAIEIFSFLGLAAIGARALVPLLPLVWIAAAAILVWRRRQWPLRCPWTQRHAALALAMALLFLCTAISAILQMFAESPLVAGLPQRPIFHDWVYLVSRAGAIKLHWPLEDPSLAGSPLQYHYFMLVHTASASLVTKLEVMQVLLRFVLVPMGAILAVQAYALGRLVARSAWGGVLAALLTVALGDLSFASEYGRSAFLGLFIRWLYVSPTFYFGVVYFGALLLAVARLHARPRLQGAEMAWLALLAAAGTGAKGTVVPVLLAALGLWGAGQWWRQRRFPVRLAALGATMGAMFLIVYLAILSSWGTGEASVEPFRILQLSGFWKSHYAALQQTLGAWLPAALAAPVALGLCGVVVFAGTAGVALLGLAQLGQQSGGNRSAIEPWFAAAFAVAALMGLMVHLDSYSELYLFLLIPLPMAALAAAFVVHHFRVAGGRTAGWRAGGWPRLALTAIAGAGLTFTLIAQIGVWTVRHRNGLTEWLRQTPHMRLRDEMVTLSGAMLWVRQHTEPDAILIANAFTPRHFPRGRGDLVDHTTAGVHFYYSALSERRLFVEGPTYALNTARVTRRMERAAAMFYHDRVPLTSLPGGAPGYAIIDRSLNDGARIALPERHRVYANARFEIYQLPRRVTVPPARETIASLFDD